MTENAGVAIQREDRHRELPTYRCAPYIRLLYGVEREARDGKLDGEARRALRREKSKPILDDIHAYLKQG